jgi:hypothetical protein
MYSSRSARGPKTPGHQEDLDAVVALWEPLAEREEYANPYLVLPLGLGNA